MNQQIAAAAEQQSVVAEEIYRSVLNLRGSERGDRSVQR
jgi:methyl-accepting chemotaxis protein